MLEVVLSPGRERSVLRRHPWVMSGAVARVRGEPVPGVFARVLASDGRTLGWGDFSPESQIRVRLLCFGEDEPKDGFVEERLRAALLRRHADPLLEGTDALRLANAEGDDLPGLVVDRYADTLVLRPSTVAMVARLPALGELLRAETGAGSALVRPDPGAARREGIAQDPSALFGTPPEQPVPIRERDRRFRVDVGGGQKTGFYLDQRDARDLAQRLAAGRRVLDLFCYTGGFAAAAARGGARAVTAVDSSQPALDLAAGHLAENAPDCEARVLKADGFRFLREAEADDAYDLIVVDPPPLARRRGDVTRASRAYKDLLLHALGRGTPGARLLFFTCSHHVGPDLLGKIVFGAALDAGRPVRWLATLGAPSDHPVSAFHPEGRYLNGALLEMD